jgi:hypothetical protein
MFTRNDKRMIELSQPEIVQSLSEKLKAYYVFPEVAEQICTCLQKHREDGEYSDITDGELFAMTLTMHMQEVNHDEHLWVRWHPEALPEEESGLRHNRGWQEQRKLEARLDNYGLYKVERLPGNVGYIDIRYFHRPEWGSDSAVAAMNFIANTEVLIMDLRKCTGGYPGMIALICSYLFGPEPIHLDSIYWRDEDVTQQYWTLPYIPGKRFGEKPIFVLISRATFSGGEGFAYILKTRQRATLLGDKTGGGAHLGASFRIHPHFDAFIPIGRTISPITGTNWEGSGVIPDILLPQEQAFTAAYHKALQAVIASSCESTSEPIKTLAEEARTALKDLGKNLKICIKCGFQNPLPRTTCKNCNEPLPEAP